MIKEGEKELRDVVSPVLKCPIDLRLWNKCQGLVGVNPCKMCSLLMIPPAKVTSGARSDALRGAWAAPLLPAALLPQKSRFQVCVLAPGVGNALIYSWRFVCNGTGISLTPGQPRHEMTGQGNFRSISKEKHEGFYWSYLCYSWWCYWMWFVFWSAITVEQPLLSRQSLWP